ncbi:MAG: OmpA family protein [Hasllibacter sp.]
MKNRLSNSTAILAALSLAAPHGALAQDAAPTQEECLMLGEELAPLAGTPLPADTVLPEECEFLTDDDGVLRPMEEVLAEIDGTGAADGEATVGDAEDGEAPAEDAVAEAAPADETGPTEEELAAELAAAEEAAEEAEEAAAEMAEEAAEEAEEAAAEMAEEAAEEAEELEMAEEAEASEEMEVIEGAEIVEDVEVVEEAETAEVEVAESDMEAEEAATDAPSEEDLAAALEEQAAEMAEAETVTDIEADTAAETATVAGDEGMAEAAPAETAEAPAEEAAAEEDLAAALEAEEAAAALDAQIETAATPEGEVGEVAEVAEVRDVTQSDTETTAGIANAAPQQVAANEAAAQDVEPAEEVMLTDEDVRSSAEEFVVEEDDEGMSNFERAVLLGLGAVAVGSIVRGLGQDGGTAQVVENTGDRVVLLQDGELVVLKDDDAVIRQPGTTISTQDFADGSTRTIATREDGSQVITIRSATGQVLRRTRVLSDGTEVVLFDDTVAAEALTLQEIERLRASEAAANARADLAEADADALRRALLAEAALPDRRFSLQQVRNVRAVRNLVPTIELSDVNFALGSAAITAEEARDLASIGSEMAAAIRQDPGEIFLIEGHTDATGGAAMNLALSDRRAESVARALTEYFGVPPENMVVQGYGESNLLVPTLEAERANRRASVRRITPLLQNASLN